MTDASHNASRESFIQIWKTYIYPSNQKVLICVCFLFGNRNLAVAECLNGVPRGIRRQQAIDEKCQKTTEHIKYLHRTPLTTIYSFSHTAYKMYKIKRMLTNPFSPNWIPFTHTLIWTLSIVWYHWRIRNIVIEQMHAFIAFNFISFITLFAKSFVRN